MPSRLRSDWRLQNEEEPSVLAINGGSSSIKFALYQTGEPLERRLYGKVDRIGLSGTNLTFHDPDGMPQASLQPRRRRSQIGSMFPD